MHDPLLALRARVETALTQAFPDAAGTVDAAVHRSAHADYQADLAMALARRLSEGKEKGKGVTPRDVAQALVERLPPDEVLERAVVSGPGFIGLTLRKDFLEAQLAALQEDPACGVPPPERPQHVVVDYSSPNLAKEMHVGHLRSSIIGDALARVLAFAGHTVVRRNHIGDWGTPFGMLIEHMLDEGVTGADALGVRALSGFYRSARAKFDSDPAFADRARARVVQLQGGDAETLALWRRLIDITLTHLDDLYHRLGVQLTRADVAGESTYNPQLEGVVQELVSLGLARESQGAICVFPPGFLGREGEPLPLIVKKQDGGYGYATTDLAALRHRVEQLGADRLLYVVGSPQSQHLAMVFATARLAGWAPPHVQLEHVAFGSVLGQDRKILKTRAGEAITLTALLEEAVDRARKLVDEKSPALDEATRAAIAQAVGIGAVKYADLVNDRIKDYVFDWNRMLAFEGNTAPYLMYAHARIHSILRKAADQPHDANASLSLAAPAERALGLELLQFPQTIARVAEGLQPHRLCLHIYDVATAFTTFYENCPVLKAPEPERSARIRLCRLTAHVLRTGLELLGLSAPTQM